MRPATGGSAGGCDPREAPLSGSLILLLGQEIVSLKGGAQNESSCGQVSALPLVQQRMDNSSSNEVSKPL